MAGQPASPPNRYFHYESRDRLSNASQHLACRENIFKQHTSVPVNAENVVSCFSVLFRSLAELRGGLLNKNERVSARWQ